MKIAAFEVRPDEKTSFARWAKAYNVEVKEYSEIPSLENADRQDARGLRFLAREKLTGNFWRNIKNLA